MNRRTAITFWAGLLFVLAGPVEAAVRVVVAHNDSGCSTAAFKFKDVPSPSADDAATNATFAIVSGRADANALGRLHDGKLPVWENEPGDNFAFEGKDGGRLLVDLGRAIDIGQVNTYSWHCLTRAPQVYVLYASDGSAGNFQPKPVKGQPPEECGWDRVAAVDTRPSSGDTSGQYGVSISASGGSLGRYRYLLFDILPAETDDDWGNTFYSEIDVVSCQASAASTVPSTHSAEMNAQSDFVGDPMDWKPPAAPPALQDRYGEAAYAELKKGAMSKTDVAALRAPGRPTDGLLVTEVIAGSQAAGLGIKAGDILMSVDGNPIGPAAGDVDFGRARTDAPQQITFWAAGTGQRTVTIQPGMLGVYTYDGWRIADAYARLSERDPRWDDDMFVAATTFMTNADLAETALAHAQQAGYRGRLLTPLAMRIAFEQCHFDDAMAWEWPSFVSGAHLGSDTVKVLNTAALLSFKLEQSLELAKRYPAELGDEKEIASAAAAYRAMPKHDRGDLLTELPGLRRQRCRQLDAFIPLQDPEIAETSKWSLQFFNAYQPVEFQIPSGHFQHLAMTPGFANAELAVHFHLRDTDQETTSYSKCVWFGLYDVKGAQPTGAEPPDFRIVLTSDGFVEISPFGMPAIRYRPAPRSPSNGQLDGTIRIVVLNNRCEVKLDDGRRLYYGPVSAPEPRRRYGFIAQTIGMTGQIFNPIWESISDK